MEEDELLLFSNHSEALISRSKPVMAGIFQSLSGRGGVVDLTASPPPPSSRPGGFDLFFMARLSHLSRAEWPVK